MEEEVREQSTGPRREGKATRGQGSTYIIRRAVREDQLSGRVPLREMVPDGLPKIRLQKGDHGRERREGSRARVRGQRKGKKGNETNKKQGCGEYLCNHASPPYLLLFEPLQ